MRYNRHGPFLSDQDDPDEKFLEELQPSTVAHAVDYPPREERGHGICAYLNKGQPVQERTALVFLEAMDLEYKEMALLIAALSRRLLVKLGGTYERAGS